MIGNTRDEGSLFTWALAGVINQTQQTFSFLNFSVVTYGSVWGIHL